MSNEPIRNRELGAPNFDGPHGSFEHGSSEHGSFEHQDLSPRGIIYFFVGLFAFLAVIYVIVFGVFRVLDSYNHANQATMSPMVAPEADTRIVTDKDTEAFPQPRLEKNERTELREFIDEQDSRLATYNWVDKGKGVVQIPIERAMDLLVQRGLPVRPQAPAPAQAQSQQQDRQQKQPEKEKQKAGSSAQ